MTIYYVDDGGSNTAPYDTWAKAAPSLQTVQTASAAGDITYVGHDTIELSAANTTITSPGTSTNPSIIISATQGSSPVAYQAAAAAQREASGANYDLILVGSSTWVGCYLKCDDDFTMTNQGARYYFDDCTIEVSGTGSVVAMGNVTDPVIVIMYDTDINFSNAGDGFTYAGTDLTWIGGTLSFTGAQPTTLFLANTPRFAWLYVDSVDLSAYNVAGGNYVTLASTAATVKHRFVNCKISATPAIYNGTVGKAGSFLEFIGCDAAGVTLAYQYADFYGDIYSNTSNYRTGGASDGVTGLSYKFVTKATVSLEWFTPLRGPLMESYISSTGSKTFTVHTISDNITFQDDEMWLEVIYLGTAASTKGTFSAITSGTTTTNDKALTPTTTPANQASSSETWTTSGIATPIKQALSITVTVNTVGIYGVRVCVTSIGGASKTVYVCPKVEIS